MTPEMVKPPLPEDVPSYQDLEAVELYCPTCRRAGPVRKHLLIVLPTGNKYEYRCAACNTSVGSKQDDDNRDFSILLPR